MFTSDVTKDKITTFIGLIIILFALSSYYFGVPHPQELWLNLTEFLFGFMLLFIDGKKIANRIYARFAKKITSDE